MKILYEEDFMKALDSAGCELQVENDDTLLVISDWLYFDCRLDVPKETRTAKEFLKILNLKKDELEDHPDQELLVDYEENERDSVWSTYVEELEDLAWRIQMNLEELRG